MKEKNKIDATVHNGHTTSALSSIWTMEQREERIPSFFPIVCFGFNPSSTPPLLASGGKHVEQTFLFLDYFLMPCLWLSLC
jgi:hypothetical protein